MTARMTIPATAVVLPLLLPAAPTDAAPYVPVTLPPGAFPLVGAGLIGPDETSGKKFSADFDFSTVPVPGFADPQQVIAWDGSGGTADSIDFSGTRPFYDVDDQLDAIADTNDALFRQLREDRAHLLFTHDNRVNVYPGAGLPTGSAPLLATVPSAGPVTLASGGGVGGAGEISYELAGAFHPPASFGVWATQSEVSSMPLPEDVDGIEVWGREPDLTGGFDKYSLNVDAFSAFGGVGGLATSIWNTSGSVYVGHSTIVAAVTSLLGPLPPGALLTEPNFIDGEAAINVDALMVNDRIGDSDFFDLFQGSGNNNNDDNDNPDGLPGDQIIFSISQIVDPDDPDGFYATGSELFVLDSLLGASFLEHGGHTWDHAFALDEFRLDPTLVDGYAVLDINGIEAVGALVVPEPATLVLTLGATLALATRRTRRS